MPEITAPAIDRYLSSMLPERDEVLRVMEAEAAKRNIPIVGPVVGRLLYQLARIIQAKNIFEMGSAIGYSTLWWARAVGDGGRVIYTDGSKKNAAEARGYFEKAGMSDRIDIRTGDALEVLSEQKPGAFDIIFLDVDKEDYPRAFRMAVPRVRSGGLIIADNVLRHGEVPAAAQKPSTDKATAAIVEFNKLLYGSAELFPTIVPLRDGVAIALKL